MVCPECRTELPDTVKFCPECGTKIAVPSSSAIERVARIAAFDFRQDIERLTKDFTGREWLFAEVDRWLANNTPRFMILTGEPGIGKSAISARLIQMGYPGLLAYHFCTARDSSTIVPNRIFRAIAAQLIETLPDYGEALAGIIETTRAEINVNIKIERMNSGQVVGVHIENLGISNSQELLDLLLRLPLQEITASTRSCFILIDSLDEAVTYTGGDSLPYLLSKVDYLPSWVRFLCTSRPERRVLRYFDELQPYILQAESPQNLADLHQYLTHRVVHPSIGGRLYEAKLAPESFIDQMASLAKGNFLYTQVLLDDIAARRQLLDNLGILSPRTVMP